jgi:hypothetical protein
MLARKLHRNTQQGWDQVHKGAVEGNGKFSLLVDDEMRLVLLETRAAQSQIADGHWSFSQSVDAKLEQYRARASQTEMRSGHVALRLKLVSYTTSLAEKPRIIQEFLDEPKYGEI